MLRYLASRPAPAALETIALACELPRSTAYHLLNAMIAEGFVTHDPQAHRFGLGLGAYEAGGGFVRHSELLQTARAPMAAVVDRVGASAYLAIGAGREVVFVCEERGFQLPPLLTPPAARLPARSTSPGHALLAGMAPHRLRHLYPSSEAFEDGSLQGPTDLAALEALLAVTRTQGWAVERSVVHPALSTVSAAIPDDLAPASAAVALVYRPELHPTPARLGPEVSRLARTIGALLGRRG